jgi:putative resolvase
VDDDFEGPRKKERVVKSAITCVHCLVRNRHCLCFALDFHPHYVTGATIRKTYDVSPSTLRDWADQGKVKAIRSQGAIGKRRYSLADVANLLGATPDQAQVRRRICYARVSSQHQHADLDRQCVDLQRDRPGYELVRDTGSGLNWKRPGLLSILDGVCSGTVGEVVVTHRDRLARIGVELLEWLFHRYNTALVVLDHGEDEHAAETDELRDDLLAVVTFFVARNNGRRSAANRKRRRDVAAGEEKEDEEESNERQSKRRKGEKDSRLSESTATRTPSTMVRDSTMDVQPMSIARTERSKAMYQEGTPGGVRQQ